tara:strand:+ start:5157 stop:6953 length:1797 start_codon:yes stop_codon:yes gene_type:complete
MEDKRVTIFPTIYRTQEAVVTSLDTVLTRIKSGKSQPRVELIRNGEKGEKQNLPAVCFSGIFKKGERNDEALLHHSGLIVLDFDHVDAARTKSALAGDKYILSCWQSPSGDGVKALVEVTNTERHRDHYRSLKKYFDEQYGLELDSTGENESRACFESYDPEIVIKKEYEKYGGMMSSRSEKQEVKSTGSITDFQKVNIAAMMIAKAEEGKKHDILIKAATLLGGYIASGIVEEEVARYVLEREIQKRDIASLDAALKAIDDGILNGKKLPISEVLNNEDRIRREMKLNDGDMSFISSDDVDYDWIEKYVNGEIELGLSTGNESVDEHFVFKKEFVMINGHSNIGKTTFSLWMIVASAMNHDWKWVIYSSENRTASVKMKLMQFALNKPVHNTTHMERAAARKWVEKHFVVIDNTKTYSYTDLILFCEKVNRHQKVDGLFIDPYNSLKIEMSPNRGVGVHEYHYEAASEFLTFSSNMDMAVWVNAHSVTESQRRKGDDGMAVAPFAEDTEHGGKWVNRSSCFITLHRKIQHPDVLQRRRIEMHVRKVRETDTGGKPTSFHEPLLFEFNSTMSGYSLMGPRPKLFTTLGEKLIGVQRGI